MELKLNDELLKKVAGGIGDVASGEALEIAENMANLVIKGGLSKKDMETLKASQQELIDAATSGNFKTAVLLAMDKVEKMENLTERTKLLDKLRHLVALK